jgi:diguanylate cyclase (GGDEF)-like protein
MINASKLRLINWPIQAKVMFWVTISQLILNTLLLVGVMHRTDNSLRQQVKAIGQEMDGLITVALIDPLLNRDYALLQRLAQELLDKKTVTAVKILGPTGEPLAQSGPINGIRDTGKSDNPSDIQWQTARVIHTSSELNFAGQPLGSVQYATSLDTQLEERKDLLSRFTLIASLTTAIAIAAAYLMSARLVRRIKTIKNVSEAAMQGDYNPRVVIDSEDELGKLAVGLNRLADSVTERMRALIKAEVLKTSYLQSAQTEQARLSSLLDSMRLGIVFLNNQQELIYSNAAVHKLWPSGVPSFVKQATNHGRERELDDGRIVFETSHTVFANNIATDGVEEAQLDADKSIGSLWIFEDVTAERQAETTIRFLAERDPLTSLYNRRSFTIALEQAIEKRPNDSLALLYIDLDDFKLVNDLKGHQQGDRVLLEFANRLTAVTRSTDVVARIGGDEFVVLRACDLAEDQSAWCERLVNQLSSDGLTGEALRVSCSIGIALYPKDGINTETLLAAADEAMYDAKRSGKNAWRTFTEQQHRNEAKAKGVMWADRISDALKTDGFEIFLQGVHHADTRDIHHFEALIRMPDPQNPGTRFNPGEFIQHAESSGKITQLDRWMIKNCIKLLAATPLLPSIAVNMSAVSLNDRSLSAFVAEQLRAFNVLGKRLHLELTETAALSDINLAQAAVADLQKLGCHICLDDFGSGFASLAYLKLINADYIKIDGIFIKGINDDKENQVLLRAIVDIAQSSGRLTVAEWIEDEAMLNTVRNYKVDLVQGYHLSKPAPAAQVIEAFSQKAKFS